MGLMIEPKRSEEYQPLQKIEITRVFELSDK
jgi:hypothetical protein